MEADPPGQRRPLAFDTSRPTTTSLPTVAGCATVSAVAPQIRDQALDSKRTALVVRSTVLLLCCALSALDPHRMVALGWALAVAAMAALATLVPTTTVAGRACRSAESVVCACGILATNGADSPLLPYLLAPAFLGGLTVGVQDAIVPPGMTALALLAGRSLVGSSADIQAFATSTAEWVTIAVAVGLLAAWVRRLTRGSTQQPQAAYVAAYRLLSQLRTVARQLPTGLDPPTIAESLLRKLGEVLDYDRAAVFVRTGGDRLVPLACSGTDRVDWDVSLSGENAFAEAWVSQQVQLRDRGHPTAASGGRSGCAAMVLPLLIGVRSYGLVGVEATSPTSYGPTERDVARVVVDEIALQLETALMFEEVRGLATTEERKRLAREIHDGIAQELVYLGYGLDNVLAEVAHGPSELTESVHQLRDNVTRLVSELRLSLFELRSDVEAHGGLGAALSEHVRSVGTSSGLTVHLSLEESPQRLPAETEAQLLRIAQEAIGNARKHARARNLWVTCQVYPPSATMTVADDGTGMVRDRRPGGYGLEIMQERATRLRASLEISARDGGGTQVQVTLGTGNGTRVTADSASRRA